MALPLPKATVPVVPTPNGPRDALAQALATALLAAVDLQTQAKLAHWNVVSPHFAELHALFDQAASLAAGHADRLAERIRVLGRVATASARAVAASSPLPDFPFDVTDGDALIITVRDRLDGYARTLRAAVPLADLDPGSLNMLGGLLEELEKELWFFVSHQPSAVPVTAGRSSST